MQEMLAPWSSTVCAMAAAGGLLLVQLLVIDVIGIRRGHVPGTPVTGGHEDALFRVTRALANTNETIAAFVLLAVAGILAGASPSWLGGLAWTWFGGRVAHMLCYYADARIPRSIAFGVSLLALIGMLVVVAGACLRS
jgi:uncharacterized MAPEG superfamily protein